MKADLSRNTFDRARHYSAVQLQQGRVVTDADWNEQADLTRYRAERQARDVIGPCGVPLDAPGYGLVAETQAIAVLAAAGVVWIAGEDGALLRSVDDGAHWVRVDLQTRAHLRALALAAGTGWAVGDAGALRKTSDGGQTWQARDSGSFSALNGVAAFDAQHAWAVGDGGIALTTADGGVHWTLAQTDAARLHAVGFADASHGLAVGQAGAIVATHDGGQTWQTATSSTSAHLLALAVFGTSQAWAAGTDGTILRSTDFGATWLPCVTPVTTTLLAIGFRSTTEGWALGEGGTLLHSTDAGAHWAQDSTGTTATLRGIAFAGNTPGWAVGDDSTALRIGAGSPDVQPVALPAVNLSITPGRCYVEGVLCELDTRASFGHQPDGGSADPLVPGSYLVYLRVWQRHLSVLEVPELREVALGGPDTATRSRTLAQVHALPLPVNSPSDWNCDSSVPAWDALVNAPRPRLAAHAEPQLAAASLCEIAASAGYRRLENQLYRVEIHQGGANPSFKWSRENGSVAYAVVGIRIDPVALQTVVRVASRGRDTHLDLSAHDRVELIDDVAEAEQRAGVLLEYLNDGDDELELVLAGVPGGGVGQDLSRHPVLRRWDQRPAAAGSHGLPIIEGTWLDLEEGVQVRFAPGGQYRAGDYWQIPARTITADVEWPRDADGDPVEQPPVGIADACCRLGLVDVDAGGAITVTSDCREVFPSLTMLEQLLYVGGDGQDAAPAGMLPQPLVVRVARGSVPVTGVSVRFDVERGGGRLDATGPVVRKPTNTEGVAQCLWTLGPDAAAPDRFQRVRARLLDADGRPLPGQTVVFGATASMVLEYVGGDGQVGSPGVALPQPLELRVANGTDPISGARVRLTVEQGGGTAGPALLTSNALGMVSIGWQLGNAGSQRLRAELLDAGGEVLQRMSFNATALVLSTGGGCEVTIGKGGQFERLDSDLLRELLAKQGGRLCLCFLPGDHTLDGLEGGGNGARISVHGCGHTSVVSLGGPLRLAGFAAVELRDLVLRLKDDLGLSFEKNVEVRLANVEIERPLPTAKVPILGIVVAQRVSISGCTITGAMPAVSLTLQEIAGDCQITHNRIIGIVNFYGPAPTFNEQYSAQVARLGGIPSANLKLSLVPAQLKLCDNTLSLLTVSPNVLTTLLANQTASGVFASAVLQGNSLLEQRNVFVAGLLSFGGNTLLAIPTDGLTPYGVMVASQVTATGNLAVTIGDQAILRFVSPSASGAGYRAANQVFILP